MRFLRKLPIRHKLMVMTMAISGVALLVACSAFAFYEQAGFRVTMMRDVAMIADMFDDDIAPGLAFNEVSSMARTLDILVAHPHVIAAGVFDKTGNLVAHRERPDCSSFKTPPAQGTSQRLMADRLDTYQDITLAGETIGVVYIGSDLDEIGDRAWHYAITVGVLLIACSLMAFLLTSRLQRIISGPIVDLASTVAAVATEKNYGVRAHKKSDDELGRLIDGFNEMLAQIQTRDAALQRAHDDLEGRVEERTHELRVEIAERRRSEEALRESHQRFEMVTRATSDVIWDRDLETGAVWRNENFQSVFGYSPDETESTLDVWSTRVHPDDRPGSLAGVRAAIDSGLELWSSEYRFRRLDGSYASVLDRARVIRDVEGRAVRMIGAMQDISALKQAQEEAVRQQARFRFIFETVPVGFSWMLHNNLASRIVNPAFTLITGVSAERCRDIDVSRMATHPDHRPQHSAVSTQIALDSVDRFNIEKNYVHQDGSVRWAMLTVRYFRDATTDEIQEISTLVDVTERKRSEAKLAEASGLLTAMLENSPDPIYFKDAQSRFVLVSRSKALRARARLPHLKAQLGDDFGPAHLPLTEQLNGLTDFDIYSPEDARLAYADEQAILLSGEGIVSKLEKQTCLDGSVSWSLTSKMPWRDSDGSIVGTFGISKDVTALKEAEVKLEQLHRQLLETSRQAGMAEVAIGVLHNVGNVLNSVNVSATLVMDRVRESQLGNLPKLGAMLRERAADLAHFLTDDPKGRKIPGYLLSLSEHIGTERLEIVQELGHLRKNIDHIKEVVAMQQRYAKVSGLTESVAIVELVEDALRMNASALNRHGLKVICDYQSHPVVTVERHKVMQILVNLIRNAKYACDDSGRTDKQLKVCVTQDDGSVRITVEDNGVGIPRENLTRIFAHGFTTRKDGHGFGLHSGALAAKELGGSLVAASEGPGQGAVFTLQLSCVVETVSL